MSHTARSPILARLQKAFATARRENGQRLAVSSYRPTRRQLIAGSAAGLLASYVKPAYAKGRRVRVAVVGAGIAGLNATNLLAKAGFNVALYEGSGHIGGRIQTEYGRVAPGIHTELGGEFIDSDHADMLALAQSFGLALTDTRAPSESNLGIAYYADGRLRTEDEVIAAFRPLAATIDKDTMALSQEITYNHHSSADVKLDRTTLRDYLLRNIGDGWLYKVLEAAYVNEYGLDLAEQSSLNFVLTIGTDTSEGFQVYGSSDQRYKIAGGNHQVVAALAETVADRTWFGHTLVAVGRKATGEYLLEFDSGRGGSSEVVADFVVLCIPFTTLRHVDLRVPLPTLKKKAIVELGYGDNAKLILGFDSRRWRDEGFDGDSYADQPFQSGWDASRLQPSPHGAFTIFPGGTLARDLGPGEAHQQAHRLLPGLDRVFPGVQSHWLGTAVRAYWPGNPFVRGSYAAYRPGQWTSIRGLERRPVGNLYFAGEHTSLDWQGYMNGGAESGRLAAEAIISRTA